MHGAVVAPLRPTDSDITKENQGVCPPSLSINRRRGAGSSEAGGREVQESRTVWRHCKARDGCPPHRAAGARGVSRGAGRQIDGFAGTVANERAWQAQKIEHRKNLSKKPFKNMLMAKTATIHLLRIGSPTKRVQPLMKSPRRDNCSDWVVCGGLTSKRRGGWTLTFTGL